MTEVPRPESAPEQGTQPELAITATAVLGHVTPDEPTEEPDRQEHQK